MDYAAAQIAKASRVAALRAAHPYLMPAGDNPLKMAAKNIRIELGRAFKGIKFSVKVRRFSMGDAIDVRWTDGPNSHQVDAIINRYQAGSFDGMDDCYNYKKDNDWCEAFGDAKYIHGARENSDKAVSSAIRTVVAMYQGNFDAYSIPVPTVEDYNKGLLWSVEVMPGATNYHSLQNLIQREMGRRTWSLNRTPKLQVVAEAVEA